MCLQCYLLTLKIVQGLLASGLQHCPELEQDTESLGIPLPFLTEKSDGLILLIDFSLQSSGASGRIRRRVEEKSSLGSFQGSA